MTVNLQNPRVTVPTAFVTKGRHRVKQYNNDTVYLNNGDEFEVEIFNPTENKVLAKIKLNGMSLGAGVVLRPGERVFLERYLNESKKFLFETYEVDGGNAQVMKAIQNNGEVSVEFCNEYVQFIGYNYGTYDYTPQSVPFYPYNPYTNGNTTIGKQVYSTLTNGTSTSGSRSFETLKSKIQRKSTKEYDNSVCADGGLSTMCMYNSNVEFEDTTKPKGIETGRIEKGSNSNQHFTYDSTTFNTFYSWKTNWKILPLSQKPSDKEDLKVYCTQCGSKKKKHTFKFCPNCGCKY